MNVRRDGAVTEPSSNAAASLDERLARGDRPVDVFREALTEGRRDLEARFTAGEQIEALVQGRAALVDALLLRAWSLLGPAGGRCSLVAVGGYGRGELHPASDVDIMVLRPDAGGDDWKDGVSRFVSFLWDIGLEVGHSVRSVEECAREARADLTVATSLMESRLLEGDTELYARMCAATSPPQVWPAREFFEAKLEEQKERHHRFDDTAYNLEPNVKSGPGGLRDIQLIGWVTQRHFGTHTLAELTGHGFLTEEEYASLLAGRAFLWRVRFGLHVLAGRREDRLLFDTQVKLARMFGYEDASYTLAVEQLMQRYYRTVMELSRLVEMLLQLLREAIVTPSPEAPTLLNERFQVRHGYLETRGDDVFQKHPAALLELFLIMQEHPRLRGVSAQTIRLIRASRHLIDEEFRQNPRHHRMFLSLLRAPAGVTHELRRMNLYGILGLYIPSFGRIVGRMQYDLFHAYTVDAHTLFVVSNLRRFALARQDQNCPNCGEIMQGLPKPELAYIAALFHDIAKGRGGDHSQLGAVDAEAFCLEQGLGRYDARLVAWLVSNHLLLSVTAQKKDIADPEVIHDFARSVGDQTHLDYLYVLTVADVRATNPKLWNSWKASLFSELYEQTKRALRRGLENPIDRDELIAEQQAQARALLRAHGLDDAAIDTLWRRFTDDYFLRHAPEEIAWHGRVLAERDMADTQALVAIREQTERGGTAIFIYAPYAPHNFTLFTAVLDELGLSILDARITDAANERSLDTYVVLEANGEPIRDSDRMSEIEAALRRALLEGSEAKVTRRAPRQVRMFATPTRIEFSDDPANERTVLELSAGDRPGLLCDVGRAFREERIALQTAKITTVGERAEDVFYITDEAGAPLSEAQRECLHRRLLTLIDRRHA
jgi:[protein-PII] uridylyltransferase